MAITYATWNPSDEGSNISLSNGNLTATKNADGWNAIRATIGKSSGKWYFEIAMQTSNFNNEAPTAGIGTSGATLANYVGKESASFATRGNGGLNDKGTNDTWTSFGGSWANPQTLMVAVDLDAGKLWFGKAGTWQGSGDPAAGTNPAFSGLSGTYFPMAAIFYNGGTFTANFGASAFVYTVPSGFNAGWFNTAATPQRTLMGAGL